MAVAPHAGAWIETVQSRQAWSPRRSLPTRERGLKQQQRVRGVGRAVRRVAACPGWSRRDCCPGEPPDGDRANRAVADARRAVGEKPGSWLYWLTLGEVLASRGDLEAVPVVRHAHRINPTIGRYLADPVFDQIREQDGFPG